MSYKRPIADSKPVEMDLGPEEPTLFLAPRHTFSFAFIVSLVGFLFLFIVGTRLDTWLGGGKHAFWELLAGPGGGSGDSLLYIAQVVAAVLGGALTVVAIVVQLAANRYTPKIIDLFVR